ncbi:MAG: Rrf2 family transcriptional regulator [Proteobacteria bacterium]|nr:Rrf2 family transcriptional regulator [Pseudomonadota bacterium]
MARAGLVEATRGAGGGYRFSGNAKRVTLYQVVEMFEDIAASRSARPEAGDGSDVGRALGRVMAEIDDIAVSTLKSITLTTLLKTVERHAPLETEA